MNTPATPKQIAYLTALLDERGLTYREGVDTETQVRDAADALTAAGNHDYASGTIVPFFNLVRHLNGDDTFSKRAASVGIEEAMRTPRRNLTAPAAPQADPVTGTHLVNGTYYRVQSNRDRTNHYAKVWNPDTNAWEYAGRRPVALCTEDTLLNADQAAAFGHQFGVCVNCSAILTDPESIARGLGPICATYY